MTASIELDMGYMSDATKASGYILKLSVGGTIITHKLTFAEGLDILKQLTEASKLYRDAITSNLDITGRLASIDAVIDEVK